MAKITFVEKAREIVEAFVVFVLLFAVLGGLALFVFCV